MLNTGKFANSQRKYYRFFQNCDPKILRFQAAVFVGPVTTIPIFLFSGFFVTMKSVPAYLRWISYISYARYSFQSTLTAVYGYERESLNCFEPYCHFKNPKKFL